MAGQLKTFSVRQIAANNETLSAAEALGPLQTKPSAAIGEVSGALRLASDGKTALQHSPKLASSTGTGEKPWGSKLQ